MQACQEVNERLRLVLLEGAINNLLKKFFGRQNLFQSINQSIFRVA